MSVIDMDHGSDVAHAMDNAHGIDRSHGIDRTHGVATGHDALHYVSIVVGIEEGGGRVFIVG